MPELTLVSGQEARKALERLGFAFLRQCGSHAIMRRGVLKQAGVTGDEFKAAL